jgi:cell wall assembly regulator SMI1
MKFRNILSAAAVALLPFAASAATLVVPAAGTGPGANSSRWQSELTLHSSAPREVTTSIALHNGTSVLGPVTVKLAARETVSIADIVKTKFGLDAGTGALVITLDDRNLRHLAVTSRTFNTAPDGSEFGQDIPSVEADDAITAGQIATINGPSSVAATRFNFGLYAVSATTLRWELVRANGTVAGSAQAMYAAGEHAQFNNGVAAVFGVEPQNNDTVYARVASGDAIFYGSIINATGDPTFVPGVATRDDVLISFGVDQDENGTVDFTDANGDGVLDQTLDLFTGAFPNYFRVVAKGEFGEAATLEVVSSQGDAQFIDANGTLRTAPFDGLKGQTGQIVVKAKVNGSESLLTIPVRYR